jgi:hypothetical protein
MRGHGPRWDAVMRLFELQRRRLGLDDTDRRLARPPDARNPRQRELFPPTR